MLRSIVSCVILFHISARLASTQFTGGTSTSGYGSYTSVNVGLTGTSPTRISPSAGTLGTPARPGTIGTTARPGTLGNTARPGTNPTLITSTGGFTSAGTSVPITTFYSALNISNTYGYLVQSLDPLTEGNISNDSILKSVQDQVVARTFNFPSIRANFIVTQVQIQRRLRARAAIDYNMLVSILFQLGNASCTITCLDNARINSSSVGAVQLPLLNGTLANVTVILQPLTSNELRANVKLGEASPGLAAKLGMGLGIAALGVVVIGEVAFLYSRTRSTPGADYSIPMHNRV